MSAIAVAFGVLLACRHKEHWEQGGLTCELEASIRVHC
jgi:hypothetical protein